MESAPIDADTSANTIATQTPAVGLKNAIQVPLEFPVPLAGREERNPPPQLEHTLELVQRPGAGTCTPGPPLPSPRAPRWPRPGWLALAGGTRPFIRRYSTTWP